MILIPTSIGELVDKITILEIKLERLTSQEQRANVRRELESLERVRREAGLEGLEALQSELRGVNERLWKIEDAIRDHERERRFDAHFVELARSVYRENDRRSELKRRINLEWDSELVEEKSYQRYD